MKKVILILSILSSTIVYSQDYNWKNANVVVVNDGVFRTTFPTNKYKVLIEHMHVILDTKEKVTQWYDDVLNATSINEGEIVRDDYTLWISKKSFVIKIGDDVSTPQLKKYIKPNKGYLATKNEVLNYIK